MFFFSHLYQQVQMPKVQLIPILYAQEQWEKVMGSNPSFFKGDKLTDDARSHPVENIAWRDTQEFIKKLNKIDKAHNYRLPTEFEWEYAARAGAKKDIPWDEIQAAANLNKKMPIAVGSKKPNAWGLHDVLGNVWEWVGEPYGNIPAGIQILRGGRFSNPVDLAYRLPVAPDDTIYVQYAGFRCAADQVKE